MPLNKDIKRVLVIGSGPIVIGQAAEFDYAGTQACRALKQEGLEVILINSNPATIMTDNAMADKIYIEPLTLETVKRVIKKERPFFKRRPPAQRPERTSLSASIAPCKIFHKFFHLVSQIAPLNRFIVEHTRKDGAFYDKPIAEKQMQ